MPNKEDLSDQLNLTTKLAAQVERMADAANRLEGSYTQQVETLTKLAGVLGQLNVDGAVQSIEVLNKSLKDMQDKMKDTGKTSESTFQKLGKKIKETGDSLSSKFPKSVSIGSAALSGFFQGMKNIVSLGKSVTSFFAGLLDGIVNVTAAIIAIPFKMFERLIDLAASSAGGSNELAEAIEALRKQFGSLSGPTNKAIIDTAENLKGFNDTGLSAFRVFGTLAERLNYIRELATEMGNSFSLIRQEMEDNGGAILAYQKGLGLTGESMKAVAQRSDMMGKKSGDTLLEMTKYSQELGKALKLDAKVIAREMGDAMKDMAHFGTTSTKSLGESVAFAHKFGLELKDITGTLDTFQSFDDAADHAAKLSQAFGVNIDSFEMMNAAAEGDAGKQIELLRDAFKNAGIDGSKFDNIQRKLIKDNTGMSDAAIDAAFSMNKQNVSLKDAQKAGDKAQKQTLTQAEAMGKLADSIERMVKSGGAMEGGFWDQFVKGFLGGIQSSKEFREIMMNIRISLREVYMQGVKLGKAFVELFPGVKEFLQGIADFFKPAKFRSLVGGVVDILKDWMKELSDPNGKASFAGLMEKLQKKFFNFFDQEAPEGKKMLDGFKKIMRTVSKVLAEALKWMADKVADGIKWIVDLLNGKVDLSGAGGAAKGGLGFLGEILLPLVDALKHAWVVISPALWELIKTLGKKLMGFLTSDEFLGFIKPAIPVIAGILFGPAFTRAIIGAATAALVKGTGSLLSSIGGKLMGTIGEKVSQIAKAGKAPTIGDKLPDAKDSEKAVESSKALSKGGSGISWGSVLKFLVAFAGVVAIGMAAVFGAIAIIRKFSITPKELIMGIAAVGAAALAMLPVAIALAIVSKFPLDPASAAIGILAIGIAVLAMVGVLYLTFKALKDLDLTKLKTVSEIMWDMSKVFIAAGAIVLIAMGIGAIILASVGIGAAAMAAGLAAMVSAIVVMGDTVIDIMKKLDKVPMGAGFKDKIEAFTKVMDSITNFAKNLTAILEAVKPSFLTLLSGKDDTVDRINAVKGMLEALIGKPGGAGIIGIMETIMKAMDQMANGDQKMLDGARAFADILNAIGSLASAMKPSDELFKSISGWFTTTDDVVKGVDAVTNYANTMAGHLKSLIDVIVKQIMPLVTGSNQLSDQQIKGAAAVGQLFGAVTQIAQGMMPSQGAIQSLRDTIGGTIGRDDIILNPKNMEMLGQVITAIATGLEKVLPKVIGSLDPILKTLGSWHFTDADAKVFSAVGPLLQQMIVMVQSVTAQSAQFATAKLPGQDVNKFLDKLGEVMPGFMQSVSGALPSLFDALKAGISKIATGFNPQQLDAGMKTFNTIMGVVGQIPPMLAQMKGDVDPKQAQGVAGKGLEFARVIHEIANFFELLVFGDKTALGPLTRLSFALSMPVIGDLAKQKDKVETVKTLFEMVGAVVKVVKDVQTLVPTDPGNLDAASQKMYNTIDQVAKFLSRMVNYGAAGEGMPPLESIAFSLKAGTIKELGKLKPSIDSLKETFTQLGAIVKIVAGDIGDFSNVDKVVLNIQNIAGFLNKMLNPGWPEPSLGGLPILGAVVAAITSGAAYLKTLIASKSTLDAMPEAFGQLKSIASSATSLANMGNFDPDKMSKSVLDLATFLNSITGGGKEGGTISLLAKAVPQMTALANVIKGSEGDKSGISGALMAINEMVQQTNNLNKALDDVGKANWPSAKVRLQAVASAIGLGGKVQYTVNPSREVIINVNVDVSMDAQELERVMIQRATSVIRNRIMWLADNPKDAADVHIPDNPGTVDNQGVEKRGGSDEHGGG